MAIRTAQVTVGTTATKLNSAPTDRRADSSIAVTAPASGSFYIGKSGVTTATGFLVPAGTSISLDLQSGEDLYGVLASGSGSVAVLETGV